MPSPPYRLEFYEDEQGNEPVLSWLRGLVPHKRRAIGVALFEILQFEGPRVVGTSFGKQVGGGIFEFRLDQNSTQILETKRLTIWAIPNIIQSEGRGWQLRSPSSCEMSGGRLQPRARLHWQEIPTW